MCLSKKALTVQRSYDDTDNYHEHRYSEPAGVWASLEGHSEGLPDVVQVKETLHVLYPGGWHLG